MDKLIEKHHHLILDGIYAKDIAKECAKVTEAYSTGFLLFAEDYILVHCKNKSAWVNRIKHTIYVHGSEEHFSNLVHKHGKTESELFTEYLETLNK